MKETIRIQLISILERVLAGNLELTEFYECWPEELESDTNYQKLFDDIEGGLEHFPLIPLKKEPDFSKWIRSDDYEILKNHLITLKNS